MPRNTQKVTGWAQNIFKCWLKEHKNGAKYTIKRLSRTDVNISLKMD